MSELRFWLLGSFQVWRGDARLDAALSGRLGRELLALLLLERDRFVPAERLMDVFWPHLGPAAAANNLRGVVLKLRRWLEPGLRRGRDSRYLVTEAEGYRFLAAGCRLDVDEFAQAAQAGQAALRNDDLPGARAALRRARDLYRGELVSDMPYAEWAFPARERLREDHLEALNALGQACLRLGAYDETLAVAQQARAVDPLRESFVRQQMQARAGLGERAEALAVCDDFQRLLERELGLEPSEETRALREAILAGTIAPLAPALPAAMSVELPLVGREEILESLERVRESGGVVLLSGEAGLGKTRLLTEFGAAAAAPIFWSQARAGDPPFAAVLRFFEEYLRREPPATDLAELGPLGAPLAQRLPPVRLRWPGCPPYTALQGEAEQQRLHQATLAALRLVAAHPAVFVLDDLHWADEDSLAVLDDLTLTGWPASVLFVGAYRSEEAGPDGPLTSWLAARRAGELRPLELELPPLSPADVLAAVRAVVGLPDPLPFSRRLHEVTAGHPLFLTEMLRGLLDAGTVYRDAAGAWHGGAAAGLDELPLTATLREAVLARAERLDPIEREVLDAAAVLRPRCTAPILHAVLQAEATRIDRALETLTSRRWLLPAGPDGWEFGHHLTGEAVYAGLAPLHRRLLHRIAAAALMAAAPAAPDQAAVEIVTHLEEGEGAAEALARWAILAGQWAAQQLSYRQAHDHFGLARAQLERLAEGDGKRHLALAVYEGLGTVLPRIGQSKAALESLGKALSLASGPADRARLLLAEAQICERDSGEYERAMALLTEAERLLGQAGLGEPARLAEIHTIQAMVHYWRGEHREGERLARQAAAGARGTPGEPRALHALASNLQKLGHLEEAVDLYDRMLQIAEEAGDLRGLAEAELSRGVGLQALGELAASLAANERAGEVLERLGDLRRLSVAYTNHGITAGDIGDLTRSEADLRQAIELAEKVDAPYTVAVARHHLGKSLTLRGRLEDAGVELEAAVALAQTIAAKVIEAQARLNLGLWYWARREDAGARAQAQITLDTGDALVDNFCRREGRLLMGTISLAEGDLQAADANARDAHRIASEGRQALALGRAERLLGQIAAARAAFEAAEAHFAKSERIFHGSGAQIELGQTMLARAASAQAAGEAKAIWRPLLLEARRLFRRTKALPFLRQAEKLLSDH